MAVARNIRVADAKVRPVLPFKRIKPLIDIHLRYYKTGIIYKLNATKWH
jgi:hypothetical protein